jgi:penicillin-binding protein 2
MSAPFIASWISSLVSSTALLPNSGFFWRESIVGKSGIEKKYNELLSGKNGSKVVEVNAEQSVVTENMMIQPEPGKNLTLTIDSIAQSALYNAIKKHAEENNFQGGSGVIMNVKNGELIAMTSYPEFDTNVLSQGKDTELISRYATDIRKVYLNRAINGLYTPGSIVKPYLAIGALQEGLITPQTTIFSSGQVEIPNRYNPSQPQIFRDWKKGGHGPTNVYTAIAESVNTFFYAIGGGYKDQPGLGISKIDTYINKFRIGTPTGFELENDKAGTVPSPEWKLKNFKDGAWRLGDTYNSSIGQFGFQVSILQMVRAVGAIANGGLLITPHIQKDRLIKDSEKEVVTGINPENYDIVRDAMRQTVLRGTAQALNVSYVSVSAKTGTAQTGKGNKFMNSWSTGFFPSNNPTYAFVVVMEMAPSTNEAGVVVYTYPVLR